ncbi:MAG: 50S ribosomal protein L11 methyltransferase [Geobacteraceae bacterium]|nr:50S ribosomal protein L11 methyltransferase [Geobacteraceae bacterium]
MKNKEWVQVSCEVPAAMVEITAEYLVELSSAGVAIENRVLDTFSIESVEDSPFVSVTAYFPADGPIEDMLRRIKEFLSANGPGFPGYTPSEPVLARIAEEDWSSSWKENFKPLRIGEHLVIRPTWEEFAANDADIVIDLDPGMAFGTGTHATTMLCLSVLERIMFGKGETENAREWKARNVLDVGTGSGILGIAAAKLGAERVIAIDLDEDAVSAATENSALNGVSASMQVSDTPLEMIGCGFDVILANILAEDLARLAPDLTKRLAPGGFLVLSGILTEKESIVADRYADFEAAPVEVLRHDEWSCMVYRRNG